MKETLRFTLFIFILSITISSYSQSTNIWGVNNSGGNYGAGEIFLLDTSTNLISSKYSFQIAKGKYPTSTLCKANNGKYYGVTYTGGDYSAGVIFEYDAINDNYTTMQHFSTSLTGRYPNEGMTLAPNGKLYGLTSLGGANGVGVLYEFDPQTNTLTRKYSFNTTDGKNPYGRLTLANDGLFYGMTAYGGASNYGVIFKYDYQNDSLNVLKEFNSTNGANPKGELLQLSNGLFYGITYSGGASNYGVLFTYDIQNDTIIKKFDFDPNTNGRNPYGSLIEYNGNLYGATYFGGSSNSGVLFKYNPLTDSSLIVVNFSDTALGKNPIGSPMLSSNNKIYGHTYSGGKYSNGAIYEFDPNTEIVTKKVDLKSSLTGARPRGGFIEDSITNSLIATVYSGGGGGYGTIIKYSLSNEIVSSTLSLNIGQNGSSFPSNLIKASNGLMYGVATQGGRYNLGVLFEFNPTNSNFRKIVDFDGDNGSYPNGNLIENIDGKLYGFAKGGVNGNGVVFEYNINNDQFNVKKEFTNTNGKSPGGNSVLYNGDIYGVTLYGGQGYGVIFKYSIALDSIIKLYDFYGDGYYPQTGLVLGSNSRLYGTTTLGGSGDNGVLFEYNISTSNYTKINTPKNVSTLCEASNGKLYGTIYNGGLYNYGSILEYDISTSTYKYLHSFNNDNDGYYPRGGLLSADGNLYGVTTYKGSYNNGYIYKYNISDSSFTNIVSMVSKANFLNSSYLSLFETSSANPVYFDSINVSSCNNYVTAGGQNITSSGVYTDTLVSSLGYDSILVSNVTINTNPNVSITSVNPQCKTNPAISLSAFPSGGTFNGNGVVGNTFNPGITGIGNYYIYYSYSDSNNCSANDSIIVSVIPNPIVTITTNVSKLCHDSDAISLSAIPSGGTFYGTGISGNVFDPSQTPGYYTVKYQYTDSNNCSSIDSISIQVVPNPVATFSSTLNSSYCEDADSVLMQATPSGGFFSGTGVIGNYFHPSSAQLGINSMYYTYYDSNGCIANYSFIYMNIVANPSVDISTSLDSSYCEDALNINLQATPVGGTFVGDGVSGNVFSPQLATIGNNIVKYTFTDTNNCVSSDSISVIVNALPTVNITTLLNTQYCSSSADISLGATPSGGSFSGIGVNGVVWSPTMVGSGNSEIIYTYNDANNCTNSDTISTLVNADPMISFSPINSNYCEDAASISLVVSPSGGIFTGAGVVGATFNPSTAGTGNHTIKYNYTDANGCSNEDSISTIVNALPVINFNSLADVCADASPINLVATPSGGTFSGSAVLNQGVFYPQISGAGTFSLSYNYTDANGCSNSDTSSIKVKSLPISTFTIPATACLNSNVNINYTGTAASSATYNWNFDNATISAGNNAGPYTVSWVTDGLKQISLSVTDSGCTSISTSNYINILSSYAMITAVGNTTACFGDSVTLFANTGPSNSYQWYDINGSLTNDTLSYISAIQSGDYYCEVTPINGCGANSDTISVIVKPQLIADFTLPANSCFGDIVPITFTGTAPLGTSYNWNFDSGIIASGSNAGPYNIIWNIDSMQTVGLTLTEGSCTSDLTEKNINIIQTPALVTALGNASFCQGENVALSANVGSYTYEWFKNGVSTSNTQAIYSATTTGNYRVKVSDNNNGCSNFSDSILITVNTTNFNISFTAVPTSFTIPPFNTNFNNQTTNANDYYWLWSFGDGNTSTFVNPAHQYLYDGSYTVGLIAQNIATGCYDTLIKTNYIQCAGGSADPCSLDASIGHIGSSQICPGDSTKLYAKDHTTGISYQWLKDGILISGATDSIYYAKQTGLYQLLLADATCSEFSQPYTITQHNTVSPTIMANGTIVPCTNDSMELYVSTSFNSYQWSNGSSAASIYINNSGSYIVTVTDNNNCQSTSQPYVVNASLLQVPDICIVGIDTATNHNIVVWERQNSILIDSFRIYRESTVAGVYDLIGSQPFSTQSVFEDVNSNTAQQAYRYRITAVDTCGMETAPSPIHKTLHLTINAGLGGVWNLIWTNYEGFNFGSYRIYRGSDSTQMTLLTQIQSTLTSYTDLNPPAGNVYYQIEIISPHPCYPDSIYSKANTNYNSSRSNTANTNMAPNTGFVQTLNKQLSMQIYPNPNKGTFNLEVKTSSNKAEDYQLEVYSTIGTLIYKEKIRFSSALNKKMNIENLSKGVYFIRLINGDEVLNTRFIID